MFVTQQGGVDVSDRRLRGGEEGRGHRPGVPLQPLQDPLLRCEPTDTWGSDDKWGLARDGLS